ncbi:NmrA-like domain [Lasallia pustulata]|uniref:NmrA-like domain n=1 Tax=Lasallia pustulata TaxID=136370 RepID=A0A1W5D2T1_9LECA|nr:NmrA-like domain [Lasallia pustulata]
MEATFSISSPRCTPLPPWCGVPMNIINYVLNDPELSQKYKIRAITRDANAEKAKQLKEKLEVVQGDVLNRASLKTALTGAHTVFAMATPSFGPDGLEVEYNSGKTIAAVAVEKGAEYIMFSTLPPAKEISGGKYTKVTPFDAKAKAEQYIRGLHIKSAFYSPGYFMENFQSQTIKN